MSLIKHNRGSLNAKEALIGNNKKTVFTLSSGANISCSWEKVAHDDIEQKTYVDSAINPRNQNRLTEQSLSRIIKTIKRQQFYPAIGFSCNGKICIVDGSRRRMAAIFAGADYLVLVADTEIDKNTAKELALEIQTSESYTLAEWGAIFADTNNDLGGATQKEIAAEHDVSASFVSRAMTAYKVEPEILDLFANCEPLALKDYQTILKIQEDLIESGVTAIDIASSIKSSTEANMSNKEAIIKKLARYGSSEQTKGVKAKAESIVSLSKKRWVKKKTSNGKVVFECAKLSDEQIQLIENFIKESIVD